MAERAFGSALELEPDNGQAWKGVAALLEAYGEERAEELLRAYEKLSELAAAPMTAADTQAGAARMAADPRLLGDPATTITDLLTTVVGLQAARVLGGVGSAEPVLHLAARLVAHAALTGAPRRP